MPHLRDEARWTQLGRALVRGRYNAGAVTEALCLPGWTAETLDSLYWELPVEAPEPLATRVEVFLQGRAVDRHRAAHLLPERVEGWGLLQEGPTRVRARRSVVPLTGRELVCADVPGVAVNHPDSVFLPDSSSLALRRVQPRFPVERHLDLGSGAGAVALAAADWCRELHLVDINERAGPMARASFALSGRRQPHVWTGSVGDATMIEPVDRLSFVLPLLVPWEGMDTAPVHTLAEDEGLLEETLALLPLLLGEGGLALLFCQAWTPSASPAALLDAAFGARPWRGGLWWEAEEVSHEGPVKVGIVAVEADEPGGWTEARNRELDLPQAWWWPALVEDLGWR